MDDRTKRAIALVYEASKENVAQAQRQLDFADQMHRVVSALDDLARAVDDGPTLRLVRNEVDRYATKAEWEAAALEDAEDRGAGA